jgi:DnaJ-class molecular chaperone
MSTDKEIETKYIVLEQLCNICKGHGKHHECGHPNLSRCYACDGSGYIPTEFGEKVLALMRHNFKTMLQDVAGD